VWTQQTCSNMRMYCEQALYLATAHRHHSDLHLVAIGRRNGNEPKKMRAGIDLLLQRLFS
jgi:hypothetical protein